MKNTPNVVFCLFVLIATSLSVSCTESDGDKGISFKSALREVGSVMSFATEDNANQPAAVEIKEETEKINNTIKLINKDVKKLNDNPDEVMSKIVVESVKKNIEAYRQSQEGQDNQFGWEFTKSIAQPNFSTMQDKKVLSSMDKFLNGLKRAKVIIVKGLKIASKIGGTVLKLVERFSNDSSIQQGTNQQFNTASQVLGKDGALNDIATILDDIYPNTSPLVKATVAQPLTSSPAGSASTTNPITEKEKANIARKLLSQLQLEVQDNKTLNAFVNSTIPKNQKILAKVDSIVKQTIELKKQKDNLSKEEKKQEHKDHKKSKKLGISVSEGQLDKIKSCAKKPEFTFFCEAAK